MGSRIYSYISLNSRVYFGGLKWLSTRLILFFWESLDCVDPCVEGARVLCTVWCTVRAVCVRSTKLVAFVPFGTVLFATLGKIGIFGLKIVYRGNFPGCSEIIDDEGIGKKFVFVTV